MTLWEAAPWITWVILLPLGAGVLTFVFRQAAPWLGLAATVGSAAATAGLAAQVLTVGPLQYPVGGWGVPLGIDLRADGLSVLMLAMTAVIGVVVSLLAAIGHLRLLRRLERGERYRPTVWSLAVGVALVLAVLGAVMTVRLIAADG